MPKPMSKPIGLGYWSRPEDFPEHLRPVITPVYGLLADDNQAEIDLANEEMEAEPVIAKPSNLPVILEWLRRYRGTNSFLVSIARQAGSNRRLSDRQTTVLADIYEAEFEKAQDACAAMSKAVATATPAATTAPTSAAIPNGYYTVVDGAGHRTFRLTDGWTDDQKAAGTRVLAFLDGPDNSSSYSKIGFVTGTKLSVWRSSRAAERTLQLARILIGDPEAAKQAGEAYAIASGRCYRCGRLLTVPASINRGLGPECASKAGY